MSGARAPWALALALGSAASCGPAPPDANGQADASGPAGTSEPDLAALEALGYVGSEAEAGGAVGLLAYEPELAQPGLNFYVSGHAAEAFLMDMQARVLHRWSLGLHHCLPRRSTGPRSRATRPPPLAARLPAGGRRPDRDPRGPGPGAPRRALRAGLEELAPRPPRGPGHARGRALGPPPSGPRGALPRPPGAGGGGLRQRARCRHGRALARDLRPPGPGALRMPRAAGGSQGRGRPAAHQRPRAARRPLRRAPPGLRRGQRAALLAPAVGDLRARPAGPPRPG